MTEPTNTSVIVHRDDQLTPAYELTGKEIIFPINVDQDGQDLRVNVRMSPAERSYEIKQFFDELLVQKTVGKDKSIRFSIGDETPVREFVSRHFLGILESVDEDGNPVSLEAQKEFLSENPMLQTRIFREGFDAIQLDDEAAATKKTLVMQRKLNDVMIRCWVRLYSPETKRPEIVNLGFRFQKDKETDHIKYRKCFNTSVVRRTEMMHGNWETIEQMFNEMIRSVDGFLLSGQPCDETIRMEWINLIPFTYKVFALAALFSTARIKNA